ncbi:arginine-specific demethylase JMJ20 isoform X2 [Actinidia eriantha]|uniref:arginine-specific demethylase JMJ20 isoform X2 n=1 Tax=Actinidia eriantha TaxID=165200 RepID=UPI00258BB2D3|nr:arginine-specific demethylase JMJ20 isoform X2 [Actinidia eriantha]
MGVQMEGQVEKVNGKDVSYSEFVERYVAKNQPVVLTGLMDGWRACKDWVLRDGRPNLRFFSTQFGNSTVQVADCATREFTDQKRVEMSVSEFIDCWLEFSSKECNDASTGEFEGQSPLYLKDWHFVKEYPEYLAYTTPLFFRDDWLNLYLDKYRMHENHHTCQEKNEICSSDYRFVYMGAKGTWTPLHADVFRSYSWSANVCGKKQWYFLSPTQRNLVFDRNLKSSVYDIFEDVSETKFPGFDKAIWLECIQEQNEIIFVPSGWYHQVHNLEDTVSINHNWFNAYNLSWVWDLLLRDYIEAKEYIEDIKDICDDFEGLCQRNLAANTGMNFEDFFIFIVRFSFANLVLLYLLERDYKNSNWSSSQRARHIAFNLESARHTVLKMNSIGLAGNGISVDFKENLEDPAFLELCTVLERTYQMLHEPCKLNDITETLVNDLVDFDLIESSASHVGTPDDLVRLIDYAFAKLSCISCWDISVR